MTKEKVTLYITNNTAASVPLSILSNPGDLDNANAGLLYKWDLTGLSFAAGNITSLALQYKASGAGSFTNFTYTGNITSFAQLLSILNTTLGVSNFYQLPLNNYSYLATSTQSYVFGNLTLLPAVGFLFNFSVDRTINPLVAAKLTFTAPTNISIDWGDGTIDVFTNQNGNNVYMHTYAVTAPAVPVVYPTISTIANLMAIGFSTLGNIVSITDISSFSGLTDFVINSNAITTLPNLPPTITTLDCSNNKVTTASINAALITVDANGLIGGTFTSNGQTPAAPPTGAGITAKNDLIVKSWTVTTD